MMIIINNKEGGVGVKPPPKRQLVPECKPAPVRKVGVG